MPIMTSDPWHPQLWGNNIASSQLLLIGYSLFFLFSVEKKKIRDGCVAVTKEPADRQWNQTEVREPFKVNHLSFLSIPEAAFELQEVLLTTTGHLNAVSCCNVVGRLAICVYKPLHIGLNKMSDVCAYVCFVYVCMKYKKDAFVTKALSWAQTFFNTVKKASCPHVEM